MSDPITNSAVTQVQPLTTAAPVAPAKKKGGGFGKILGGILGGAVNLVAPGLGTVIGSAIGGGSGIGGSSVDMQGMLNQQMQQSMELLSVQNRVQSQTQEFTTMSNLLKTRHDSEMSAVNNFKS